jgi:hypothetical protein
MSKIKVWFNRHFSCVAKVIRELRKDPDLANLRYCVSHRHQQFAGYSIADESFVEPSSLDANSYLDWVLQEVRAREIDCIVPGHEQSFLTSHMTCFEEIGCRVFCAAPPDYISSLHSKDWVYQKVAGNIPIPCFYVVRTAADFQHAVEAVLQSGRRACVKPVTSVYGLGFFQVSRNKNSQTWQHLSINQWLNEHAPYGTFSPQLVMEYLPGHEYSVDIAARHGVVLASVIRRKPLRTGPQQIVAHDGLQQNTAWLVERFKLNGLVNIQFKEDDRGEVKLLEINPRASGGIGMSCQGGINLPAIAYRAFFEPTWQPQLGIATSIGKLVFESNQDLASVQPRSEFACEAMDSHATAISIKQLTLPTGELTVQLVEQSVLTADQLLGFGARNNRQRGFLFVSKVLGKHVPVRPKLIQRVHRELAQTIAKVDRGLGAIGIVVGMAETATGLGMGIFGELQRMLTKTAWKSYHQTTRYPLSEKEPSDSAPLQFEELHSHARALALEMPRVGTEQDKSLRTADTILLVDDEISTGKTFVNLLRSLRSINTSFKHLIVATITDLSDGRVQRLLADLDGIDSVSVVSLISGNYEFKASENSLWSLASSNTTELQKTSTQDSWSNFSARHGISQVAQIPEEVLQQCRQYLMPGRCRVIGTTEFIDPAYRLALQLESNGWETYVQSTTRSPLLISHEIVSVLPVIDPYCSGTPNFLYNFKPERDENILVVHESMDRSAIGTLMQTICDGIAGIEVNLLDGCVRVHKAVQR